MSQRKWLILLAALSTLIVLVIVSFIIQLKNTTEQLEAIHERRLDSYQAIEEIMYYNIERANALRGLLAYKDRRFLETYYSLSQQAADLKMYIRNDDRTPSSLLDLLYRDGLWEKEADRVIKVYEEGDTAQATSIAEMMSEQRQTILEDLRALKKMQYEDIRKQLSTVENQIGIIIQAFFFVASLLVIVILVLLFFGFKTQKKDRPIKGQP